MMLVKGYREDTDGLRCPHWLVKDCPIHDTPEAAELR